MSLARLFPGAWVVFAESEVSQGDLVTAIAVFAIGILVGLSAVYLVNIAQTRQRRRRRWGR